MWVGEGVKQIRAHYLSRRGQKATGCRQIAATGHTGQSVDQTGRSANRRERQMWRMQGVVEVVVLDVSEQNVERCPEEGGGGAEEERKESQLPAFSR